MSGFYSIRPERGWFEPALTKAFGTIADAYSAIGTAIGHPTRVFILWNKTNKDVWISLNGTDDHFPILAGGSMVIDDATNGISLPKGTVFYVKRFTAGDAPTSGSVILSIGYTV